MSDRAATADAMVRLLTSIDARLAYQNKLLRRQLPPEVATDEQLDHPKGDPPAPFSPKGWKGESFKGRKLSECSPEFLDALAPVFDWYADQKREAGDFKKAGYDDLAASRCRGWSKRLRDGWLPPDPAPDAGVNPFAKPPPPPPPPSEPEPDPDDF